MDQDNITRINVNDIKDGAKLTSVYLLKDKSVGTTKGGKTYLTLKLVDRTGEVECKIWDNADDIGARIRKNDFVAVEAVASTYNEKIQLTASNAYVIDDNNVNLADFQPRTERNFSEMLKELLAFIETMNNQHLKELLKAFFENKELRMAYTKSPAAKGMHHVYLGGLIEHSLSVAKLADLVVPCYPGTDRDLVVAGALLHDIGKIKELTCAKAFDYTDEGRLIGHIVIGYSLISDKIKEIDGFPEDLGMLLKHMILSHHGEYEYGSPKRPKTVEAEILNALDDLDAKVNGIRSFQKESQDSETGWTSHHRLHGRCFYRLPQS